MPVWCVLKMYNPFLITDGPFSRPAEWKLSSSWKICSPTGLTKRLTWQITKKLGCGRGPSCQPLHVQYSSDGSRSLTTLTTPRREHQGGGRRRGLGRGRRGAGEDAAVDAHAERSTRVHWFGCGVRLPSPQGLASGGNSRGRWGLCGSTAGHGRQEHAARPALLWAAGARRPEVEEALRPLDGHRTVTAARIVYID